MCAWCTAVTVSTVHEWFCSYLTVLIKAYIHFNMPYKHCCHQIMWPLNLSCFCYKNCSCFWVFKIVFFPPVLFAFSNLFCKIDIIIAFVWLHQHCSLNKLLFSSKKKTNPTIIRLTCFALSIMYFWNKVTAFTVCWLKLLDRFTKVTFY